MNFGKRREDNKLNLKPILDAVFIFIFFLLMSAQFLDLHEIGSDVPIVQSLPSKAKKDKSLHLIEDGTSRSVDDASTISQDSDEWPESESEEPDLEDWDIVYDYGKLPISVYILQEFLLISYKDENSHFTMIKELIMYIYNSFTTI